ncbi:MAG: hypothetical protein LC667_09460 [Thioalkalivibrio sp.]|nr:hypothetical protein [Thioalkalivibrio sp.]
MPMSVPSSYVVIDARSRKVFAPEPPFHALGVTALDLPQDLWRDFLFHAEEAKSAEQRGDSERRYRFVRSALLSLFAHLNAFFDMLIESRKSDTAFQAFRKAERPKRRGSPDWPRSEHGEFAVLFTDYAKAACGVSLPAIDWSIRPLRNLLAHPAGTRDVTVADLYNLDVDELLAGARSFERWIIESAKLCAVAYEIDTASLSTQFAATLSKTDAPLTAERF